MKLTGLILLVLILIAVASMTPIGIKKGSSECLLQASREFEAHRRNICHLKYSSYSDCYLEAPETRLIDEDLKSKQQECLR